MKLQKCVSAFIGYSIVAFMFISVLAIWLGLSYLVFEWLYK